jgi:cobalt-precorrin 5A hydrolase/precorrin-3B C17-methyltransferase
LARNLGRETESVEFITLAELEVDMVDMLTLVLVGSSTSKRFIAGAREWAYTPRGYAKKMN